MPTAGLEYNYPFISVQSWGTQTIEPIAQVILRPNEAQANALPNEDAQSLIFDDSNLFKVDKFSGWDRVEGGGRVNAGVQYTAQFNRGGNVNLLFGESYQMFGKNSFAVGGLDQYRHRQRARHHALRLRGARLLPAELDLHVHVAVPLRPEPASRPQRMELETSANFGRWNTTVMYGDYAAQPALGLDQRQGILANGRYKLNENWVLLGGALYDVQGREAQPDPDRARLHRRLPHLGLELHDILFLQRVDRGQQHHLPAAEPADAGRRSRSARAPPGSATDFRACIDATRRRQGGKSVARCRAPIAKERGSEEKHDFDRRST